MKEFLKFILTVAIIVIPVRMFIAEPFVVSGASMSPTFETGHYLIVDKISYRFSPPKRGDVIVLKYPKHPDTDFIKRIIGLPGETLDIKAGKVTVTKKDKKSFVLSDSFVDPKNNVSDSSHIVLLENEYFVMGDNRAQSSDSRSWGPLPRDLIIGRALLRLFPLSNINIFPGKVSLEQ